MAADSRVAALHNASANPATVADWIREVEVEKITIDARLRQLGGRAVMTADDSNRRRPPSARSETLLRALPSAPQLPRPDADAIVRPSYREPAIPAVNVAPSAASMRRKDPVRRLTA